jgi:hypothetical protein
VDPSHAAASQQLPADELQLALQSLQEEQQHQQGWSPRHSLQAATQPAGSVVTWAASGTRSRRSAPPAAAERLQAGGEQDGDGGGAAPAASCAAAEGKGFSASQERLLLAGSQ